MNDTVKNLNEADIPVAIFLNKVKRIPANIRKNVEFLFVLKGELKAVINNQSYELKESDVVLVNNGDVYELSGEKENLVLSMQIENDFFNKAVKKSQGMFLCNSSIVENSHYDEIRKILSRVMYEYSNKEAGFEFKIMSLLYDLIHLLYADFLLETDSSGQEPDIKSSKYTQRINNIVSYIRQNYNQEISLQDVADSQYLTPEYMSKFFKIQMGMTFSKYLNEFRLAGAVKELIRTDDSVTKIAMNNGFPNLVALNKIFKEVYDTTPAEYRSQIRKKQSKVSEVSQPETAECDITKVDYNQAFEDLKKYVMDEEKSEDRLSKQSSENILHVEADAAETKAISHSWRNLINLGYAQDGLRSDLQQHLTNIQDRIKFRYARFQGIFSDEMFNYGEENEKESGYNFTKIDKLIDFLYSINLKPFIELGNKAKVLNLASDKIMYFKNSSEKQKGLKESLDLLEKFIVHCINRYGINEVSQWYFELWKEGDIDYVFWNGNFEKYLNTFRNYSSIIKGMVPDARVGGPGFNPEINMKWFEEFLNQVKKTETKLDFLSVSLYPYELIEDSKIENMKKSGDLSGKTYKNADGEYLTHLLPSKDRNFSKNMLDRIRKVLKASGAGIPEIHVTEYNASISHRHPANDTTFKAAYIAKNITDNLDETDSFGYWFCSDISGELKDSKNLLYGDMGLISANGINKPGFYAYEMLSKLGNDLIQKGDGYIITKKSAFNYEIIAYNYKHFDHFYCLKEETPVNLQQYYSIYEDQKNLNISINVKGIRKGRYRVKKYILNREHGSIFDEWLNMNTIYNIKKDEIDYLKQICVPKQTVFYVEAMEELKLESCLSPHEVNFFEITFEYS